MAIEIFTEGLKEVLLIDGQALGYTIADSFTSARFNITDQKGLEKLFKYSLNQLSRKLKEISFSKEIIAQEDPLIFSVDFTKQAVNSVVINISYNPKQEDWANPWTIREAIHELRKCLVTEKGIHANSVLTELKSFSGLTIYVHFKDDRNILGDCVNSSVELLIKALKETRENLISRLDVGNLVTFFKFPEKYKVPINQYLQYFTQFLEDLGIAADLEIKDDNTQTIFKVIPKQKDEGLGDIRRALDVFISGPEMPNGWFANDIQTDIAVKQWQANFLHLKNQLLIMDSVLQLKNATIESLKLSNYQLKENLAAQKKTKPESSEKIFGNIVEIKKYEGKGFSIDYAEIFRKLKRKFKD